MLKVELITSIDRLRSLREPWDEALSRSSADDVHLTWEWFYVWSNNFAREKLFILIVKEGDRILAIAPFMKEECRYFGLPVIKIGALRNFYSSYFDIILTERTSECMEAIFKYLEKERWDILKLGDLLLQSQTIRELEDMAKKRLFRLHKPGLKLGCPYITVTGGWEGYYGTLSKRFRDNIRYSEKKLEDIGIVNLREIRSSEGLDEYLEKFFQIEAAGWKGEEGTAILCDKKAKDFYSEFAHLAAKRDWLSLYFLKVDNKEIAADYCMRYKKTISELKKGYDPGYAKYSPGTLIIKKELEGAFKSGLDRYDMLGMDEAWKRKWTSDVQGFVTVYIYKKDIYATVIYYLQFGFKEFLKKIGFLRRLKIHIEDTLKHNKTRIVMAGPGLGLRGGISSFEKYYIKSALAEDFEVIHHPTTKDGSNVLKIVIFIKSLISFFVRLSVDRRIKVVHICTASGASFYRKSLILLISRIFMKKTLLHIHGAGFDIFYDKSHPLRRFYIKKILDAADTIVVLSESWYSKVRKMTGNENIKIIPNPVDSGDFKEIASARDFSAPNILTVGRLEKRKGAYEIPVLASGILKEMPQAKFYLAGDGDIEQIKGLCRKMGLEKEVIVLGWLNRTELLKALKDASMFLLPSYHEGLPIAMLEAMASGLPVVSTRVGGIPEVIEDGVNGFLVEPGEKQELSCKIMNLLKDRALSEKMGKNNIRKIDSTFNSNHVRDIFVKEYKRLISND